MKLNNRIFALVLALMMIIALVPAASAAPGDFELYSVNHELVADQDSRYVVLFTQDGPGGLITATIQIQNNRTVDNKPLVIHGIGSEISFDSRVSPVMPDGSNPYTGGLMSNLDTFRNYVTVLPNRWEKISTQYIQNDNTRRMIGAMIVKDDDYYNVSVPAGGAVDIAKYYFMPNGGETLDLDMFSFEIIMITPFAPVVTWWANGGTYLTASSRVTGSNNQISPEAFKIHVQLLPPENLSADEDARIINNYNASTMEWATSATGPYSSGNPVITDESANIFVRMKGTDYIGGDATYGNYKKALPSDPVELTFGTVFYPVDPSNAIVTKSSRNTTTRPDGTTRVGDLIEYTVTVQNTGHPKSTWADVVMTDVMPDDVTFVNGSVRINGALAGAAASYDEPTRTLTVTLGDLAGGDTKNVTFQARVNPDAYGKVIKNTVTVEGTDGKDGEDLDKTVTEPGGQTIMDKSAIPVIDPIVEGDTSITGTGVAGAAIVVTFPGGATATATVNPVGVWTVAAPPTLVNGNTVTAVQTESGKEPSDPASAIVGGRPTGTIQAEKTGENQTPHDDGKIHVNDRIMYTIKVTNVGDWRSILRDVVVTDPLSQYVTFVPDSVKIDGVAATPTQAYLTGRTLTVNLGDIAYGTIKEITFEVTVNPNAYKMDITNSANVKDKDGGNEDIDEPGPPIIVVEKSQQAKINAIVEGDAIVTGTDGVVGATIVVTFPGNVTRTITVTNANGTWQISNPPALVAGDSVTAVQTELGKDPSDPYTVIVGDRPAPALDIKKTADNKTSTDGKVRVNDVLEYTVVAKNTGDTRSILYNAVMTDELKTGVTFVPGSVTLNGADAGAAANYNSATRTLTVQLGNIAGGGQKTVTFRVTVDPTAFNKNITNSVTVEGDNGGGKTEEPGGPIIVEGKSEDPTIDEVNEGDRVVTGQGIAGAEIKVTLPNGTVLTTTVQPDGTWSVTVPRNTNLIAGETVKAIQTEPLKDQSDEVTAVVQPKPPVVPYIHKTSENLTSQDEYAHVKDRILYTITVMNKGEPKSLWSGVIMTDALPDGITLDTTSIRLDGRIPTYYWYNAADRILMVTIGDIPGNDTTHVITFEATINEGTSGMTIKNTASVKGTDEHDDTDKEIETEEDGGQEVVEKSENPIVDPVKRDDENVTGEGVPGAEIIVTFPGGETGSTTVDPDGTWTVPVPDDVILQEDDEIKVIQVEPNKEPSDEIVVVVTDMPYRAVTGLVFPMVTRDDLGEEFLRMHDIVVELRPTYLSEADPSLRTMAVRINDNGEGRFTIEKVPFGSYVLSIKRPGYIERCLYVTVSEDDADIIDLTPPGSEGRFNLWAGDALGHLTVDGRDILYIMDYFDYNCYDDMYRPECDLDGNGTIDGRDILMLYDYINRNILMYPGCEDLDLDT